MKKKLRHTNKNIKLKIKVFILSIQKHFSDCLHTSGYSYLMIYRLPSPPLQKRPNWVLVDFVLNILRKFVKIDRMSENKNDKYLKIHTFQDIAHLLGQKIFGYFFSTC